MHYQLIALDMDETLLNSKKELTPGCQHAIEAALAAGKQVVLCTGRAVAELEDTFALLPGLRYAICESGACIYDAHEKRALAAHPLNPALVEQILKIAEQRDIFLQSFSSYVPVISSEKLAYTAHYHVAQYNSLFEKTALAVPDPIAWLRSHGHVSEKINLYHASPEERERTMPLLKDLDAVLAYSEETSIEVSPSGVDKGTGLKELCDFLHIPVEASIAVGDSFNDLTALRTAGLAVAMGNARDLVKQEADVMVADCNHDGAAEAIERYLLA